MSLFIKPSFVSKPYDQYNVVYIRDFYQAYLYWKNGLQPYDIYIGMEDKKMTFVFPREESKPLYEKYRKLELK